MNEPISAANRAERTALERQVREDLNRHCPLWPDIDGAQAAFARVIGPRNTKTIRTILNGELGRHLQRRRLGNRVHYNREQLAGVIVAHFYDESEPMEWGEKMDPTHGSSYTLNPPAKKAQS